MNKIINYTVQKLNEGFSNDIIDTRTSIEKNENILDQSNDYKVQVKSFKTNINLPIITLDENDRIAFVLTGDVDTTPVEVSVVPSKTDIYNIEQLVININLAMIVASNRIKSNNPTFASSLSASDLHPFIKYSSEINSYAYLVPTEYNAAPYSFDTYLTPKISRAIYFGYLETLFNSIIDSTNREYYRVDRNIFDQVIEVVGHTFRIYVNRDPEYKALTDNDSLVIVAKSVPVNGSLEHKEKRIETQILKQYKLTSKECEFGIIVYNGIKDDYYELISHYPLSRIDIELFIRKDTGELLPVKMHSKDFYSVDLEFVKI